MFHICGIGNAVTDYNCAVSDEFLEQHSISKGGMTLVDKDTITKICNACSRDSLLVMAGGSVANSLVAAASLGASSYFVGLRGNDKAGNAFFDDMHSHNIDVLDATDTDNHTSLCLTLVTPDAQRSMCVYLGASLELSCHHINQDIVTNSIVTLIEGYILDTNKGYSITNQAISYAHNAKRLIALSLSDLFLVQRHRNHILDWIHNAMIDILIGNEDEMAHLCQVEDKKSIIDTVNAFPCKTIAITQGDKGSTIIHNKKTYTSKAIMIDKLVDTTAAGDYYCAGFMYGLTQEYPMQKVLNIATQCASEIIKHRGTRIPYPLKIQL